MSTFSRISRSAVLVAILTAVVFASWPCAGPCRTSTAVASQGLRLPRIIGSLALPGDASGVTTVGGYAYVAYHGGGMAVIDVRDPSMPMQIGSVAIDGDAYDVAVADQRAFVAYGNDHESGVAVIDLSRLDRPRWLAKVATPGYPFAVTVSDGYAYVADFDAGLTVINATLGRVVASVRTPGYAYDVAVSGDYAYVADWGWGLATFNVSEPNRPYVTSSQVARDLGLEASYGVAAHDDRVYLAGTTCDVPLTAWDVHCHGGLAVLDVGIAGSPRFLGSVTSPSGSARGVDFSDGFAYMADGSNGLAMIDVRSYGPPRLLGLSGTQGSAKALVAAGHLVYVAAGTGGLVVLEIEPRPWHAHMPALAH